MVLLLAVTLIVATGACLIHPDDHDGPDLCPSLLAVTLGLMLAFSLGGTPEIVFARLPSFEPLVPPPRA
jgi:hypothetical protein